MKAQWPRAARADIPVEHPAKHAAWRAHHHPFPFRLHRPQPGSGKYGEGGAVQARRDNRVAARLEVHDRRPLGKLPGYGGRFRERGRAGEAGWRDDGRCACSKCASGRDGRTGCWGAGLRRRGRHRQHLPGACKTLQGGDQLPQCRPGGHHRIGDHDNHRSSQDISKSAAHLLFAYSIHLDLPDCNAVPRLCRTSASGLCKAAELRYTYAKGRTAA